MFYVLNECFLVDCIAGQITVRYGDNNMSWVTNTGYGNIKSTMERSGPQNLVRQEHIVCPTLCPIGVEPLH